jgi:hypothetical protein
MTAVTTTVFRDQLTLFLAEATGVRFEHGMIEGPVERRDVACTFPITEEEFDENTTMEVVTVGVRFYQAYVTQTAVEKPVSPAKLEAWSMQVKEALRDPWGSLGVWYCRVTRTEYDLETQGVQFTIIGWQENPQSLT